MAKLSLACDVCTIKQNFDGIDDITRRGWKIFGWNVQDNTPKVTCDTCEYTVNKIPKHRKEINRDDDQETTKTSDSDSTSKTGGQTSDASSDCGVVDKPNRRSVSKTKPVKNKQKRARKSSKKRK
jgi:hypothetical protein